MENKIISYAQNREDVILSAFFPDIEHGFYVDIGAHHPTKGSVTKYFYDRGWRGINVEPNKKFHKMLQTERPRDINVNLGIADKKGELSYREYKDGDGLSTFSKDMQGLYEKQKGGLTKNYEDHTVPVITLKELFDQQKIKSIQFLKIDIEGLEYEALSGNDWKKYRPEIICIEANHIIKDWHNMLQRAGYELVFNDGLNEYHSCSPKRTRAFSYVSHALGENVVHFEDYEYGLKLKHEAHDLKQRISQHEAREAELQRELVHRDAAIAETRRFRVALRNLLRSIDNIILTQIGRLNHPKRKRASRNINIPQDLEGLSNEELLQIARTTDMQNYYTQSKGSGSFETPYLYRIILSCYTFTKKIIKVPLKLGLKLLRKIKRAGS